MGEKHRISSRSDTKHRAILAALAPLPSTAKVADLILAFNALLFALAPERMDATTALIPGSVKDKIADKLAKAEAKVQKARDKKKNP